MKHRFCVAVIVISGISSTPSTLAVELNEGDILSSGVAPVVVRVDPATGDGDIVSGTLNGVTVGTGPDITARGSVGLEANGNLVVANNGSDSVIRIDPLTGNRQIVSGCIDTPIFPGCTLAGTGTDSFRNPTDAVVESDGNILVIDQRPPPTSILFRVDPVSGDRTIVSSNSIGNGPAFSSPTILALDLDGNILVCCQFGAIYRVDPITGDRAVVSQDNGVGVPPTGSGRDFGQVSQMAVEADGSIVVTNIGPPTDAYVLRVNPLSGDRTVVSGCDAFLGVCTSIVGTGTNLVSPGGISVESDGSLIVSDRGAVPPPGVPGVLFRIDPLSGDRSIVSSFAVGSGPVGVGALTIVSLGIQNQPPSADAGTDQAVRAGDTVFLDGSASFDDNTPSEALTYAWSFLSMPAGSGAILTGADTATPTFVADVTGSYVIELVVIDEGGLLSSPDEVVVSSDNLAPISNAGIDQLVIVGSTVFLDGTASVDPETDPLTYDWTFISAPFGSAAVLLDSSTATPSFVADVVGQYDVSLTVSDLIGPGLPDTVAITAVSGGQAAIMEIVIAGETVTSLVSSQVTTNGNKRALLNFLTQAVEAIELGDVDEAINKLHKALSRTDGCALRGAPDGNGPGRDWVTDCNAQSQIHGSLQSALDALLE